MTRMTKRIIGHRSARDLWPENGLTGFRKVLGLGVAGVEFDVHPTRDGNLAVIHDPTLDRTTDGKGPVAAHSMAELRGIRLTGSEEGIPSLDEVLDVLAPSGVELHIELKVDPEGVPYPGLEDHVVDHIRRRGLGGRAVLTSFWPDVLRRLRAAAPDSRLLASISGSSAEKLGCLDVVLDSLDELGTDYVAVHHLLLAQEMERLLQRVGSARLGAWVINEPGEIERWLEAPVTLITTDRPDRFAPPVQPPDPPPNGPV